MECSFYDMSLTRIGAISTWVSMVWEDRYNTEGKFQIELQYQKDLFDLIQPDVYCGLTGHDTLMLIKSVRVKDGKIVANGFSACTRILNDRVSTRVISNQNAEAALLSLISAMPAWPRVYAGEAQGLTDIYTPQISDGALLKYVLAISAETDMGFRMRHDPEAKKLLFECYKPALDLNARYSTKYGNMGDITYSRSDVNFKNVALVAGAGEGANRVETYAGATDASAEQRREMYVDARQEQPDEGETSEEYIARLQRIGMEKLTEQMRIENIGFSLDDTRRKVGDLVLCKIPELGVDAQVRITGITEKSQNNKLTRTASLGTPIIARRY